MMRSLMFVGAFLATSCGGSMYSQQINDYRATTNSLDTAVDAHAKSAPAAAPSTCPASMADYAQKAGALVDRMQAMSGGMDQCMTGLGRAGWADFAAGCAAIRIELDDHAKNGCSAPDLTAEMTRHAAAMKAHLSVEVDRMGQMQGMEAGVGTSMMSGLPGCH